MSSKSKFKSIVSYIMYSRKLWKTANFTRLQSLQSPDLKLFRSIRLFQLNKITMGSNFKVFKLRYLLNILYYWIGLKTHFKVIFSFLVLNLTYSLFPGLPSPRHIGLQTWKACLSFQQIFSNEFLNLIIIAFIVNSSQ